VGLLIANLGRLQELVVFSGTAGRKQPSVLPRQEQDHKAVLTITEQIWLKAEIELSGGIKTELSRLKFLPEAQKPQESPPCLDIRMRQDFDGTGLDGRNPRAGTRT
jgi:hypothetical protein